MKTTIGLLLGLLVGLLSGASFAAGTVYCPLEIKCTASGCVVPSSVGEYWTVRAYVSPTPPIHTGTYLFTHAFYHSSSAYCDYLYPGDTVSSVILGDVPGKLEPLKGHGNWRNNGAYYCDGWTVNSPQDCPWMPTS